jgi:hypothetical protein
MRGRGWAATLGAALALVLSGCGGSVLQEDVAAEPEPTSSRSAKPRDTKAPTPRPQRPKRTKPRPAPQQLPTDAITDLDVPPMRLGSVIGADAGWPQCPAGMGIPEKKAHGGPMPLEDSKYVILGLTNGPSFTPNPCLADQVRWVRERGMMIAAYAVHSYPSAAELSRYGGQGPFDAGTRLGRLANVGYAQTEFDLATMRKAGMPSPIIWLDVEPVPDYDWSSDLEANAAVFKGAARGIRDAGLKVGAYSTPYLWEGVVGDFSLGGVPEWRAAGQTSQAEALERCTDEWAFQGGAAIMGQWVQYNRDRNITCPDAQGLLTDYFHQF